MAWSFGNNSSFIDAGAYTMRGFDSDNSGNAETAIQNFIDAIKVEIAKMEQTTVSMMNSALKGTAQQNKIATYVQNTIDELNKVSDFFTAFITGIKQAGANYIGEQAGINVNEVTDAKSATGFTSDQEVSGVKPFSD